MRKSVKQLFEELDLVNFMTPHVVEYYDSEEFAIELSRGEDITGAEVFGVTVVRRNDERIIPYDVTTAYLSKLFYSREAADKYIEVLVGGRTTTSNPVN